MRITRPLAMVAAVTAAVTMLTAPAVAASSYDPRPRAAGAEWLGNQLTKNLIHNEQYDFDDYGLSVDVALGLDAAGKKATLVNLITKAVAKNVDFYTTFGANVYAGATAKALVLAVELDKNPRSFGGTNLVTQLEGRVATAAPITGRIEDAYDPADEFGGDFANVIGQAYAAAGLSAVGSPKAASATAFLLQQQCSKGFFRLNFTADKTDADQSCDGAAKAERSPDTDATSIAVLALQHVKGAKAKAAVKKAVAWLEDRQLVNGSFGGGTSTEAPNTNSTGLAGWALGVAGATGPAERAATWVRIFQVSAPNPCSGKLDDAVGAIAYDVDAYESGLTDGIRSKTSDQWRRASAQALPVLRWAPRAEGTFTATGPGTVTAGSTFAIRLTGVAPGQRACRVSGGTAVEYVPGKNALGKLTVYVPQNAAGTRTYAVWIGSRHRDVTVRVTG
jgi:hypothetical protein